MKFVVTTLLGKFVSAHITKENEDEVTEFLRKAVGGTYTHLKFDAEDGNVVILSHDVIKNCVIKILKDENK